MVFTRGHSVASRTESSSNSTERGNWKNQCDFVLSCIGYTVGLGNVWRFPYLCFTNGGGAFLIPYLIFLFTTGLPLFYLELAIGQYGSLGPNVLFKKISPVFEGVGYTMLFITGLVIIYYNMVIAWSVFYTFASFTSSELPWTICTGYWNTQNCFIAKENRACLKESNGTEVFWNQTCISVETVCSVNKNTCYGTYTECLRMPMKLYNNTHCTNNSAVLNDELEYQYISIKNATTRITSTEEYFNRYVLSKSSGWDDLGGIRWQLVLCLLFSWIIVILCLINGVHSSGKVVYFTALNPFLMLLIFLIAGLLLDGSIKGIMFYITPDWTTLSSGKVWYQAATQVLYSLGTNFGCLITLSSYNTSTNNCRRDAILVVFINCFTSIFAGFVVFSILGHLSHELDVPIDQVAATDIGLAFITYPDAITRFPYPKLWCVLFFLMMICLGLDSQFAMVETIITAIIDAFPELRIHKRKVVVGTCGVCFILGLPLCLEGGIYLFNLMDYHTAGWSVLLCGTFQVIVIVWIYGGSTITTTEQSGYKSTLKAYWNAVWRNNKFDNNIKDMLGSCPSWYWKIMWVFVSPFIMILITFIMLFTYQRTTLASYVYPINAEILGFLMAFGSVSMIPLFFAYRVHKSDRWFYALKPSNDFGPYEAPVARLNTTPNPSYQTSFNNLIVEG